MAPIFSSPFMSDQNGLSSHTPFGGWQPPLEGRALESITAAGAYYSLELPLALPVWPVFPGHLRTAWHALMATGKCTSHPWKPACFMSTISGQQGKFYLHNVAAFPQTDMSLLARAGTPMQHLLAACLRQQYCCEALSTSQNWSLPRSFGMQILPLCPQPHQSFGVAKRVQCHL